MTMYLKRKGNMMFWRIGKLGGSFYYAANATETTEKCHKITKRELRRRLNRETQRATFWQNLWRESNATMENLFATGE